MRDIFTRTIDESDPQIYISQRGHKSYNRPLLLISRSEREDILYEYIKFGALFVRDRHNISNQTLGHIKFHNKGIYYRAIQKVSQTIRAYAKSGYTSLEIGTLLKMSLKTINTLW